MANVLDSYFVVGEFELRLCYYVYAVGALLMFVVGDRLFLLSNPNSCCFLLLAALAEMKWRKGGETKRRLLSPELRRVWSVLPVVASLKRTHWTQSPDGPSDMKIERDESMIFFRHLDWGTHYFYWFRKTFTRPNGRGSQNENWVLKYPCFSLSSLILLQLQRTDKITNEWGKRQRSQIQTSESPQQYRQYTG